MKEIGVSRTPIREAINMLEVENLLTIMPRRAVAVSDLSLNEVGQMYTVRALVEPFVARLACRSTRRRELEKFSRVFSSEKIDPDSVIKSDFGLHKLLVELTENRYLIRLMDNVLCQNMRFVVLGTRVAATVKAGNREHMEIIEKVLNHDEAGAEAAMRTHIASAQRIALTAGDGEA